MSSKFAAGPRSDRAWIVPSVSTVVTVPSAIVLLALAGISGMACDSCENPAAGRFERSWERGITGLLVGYAIAGLSLLAAWVVEWREGNALWCLFFALLAPCAVALSYAIFHGMVDWP